MDIKSLLLISFVFSSMSGVLASKILLITQLPTKSHYILGRRIAEILTDRGHEVTFATVFTSESPACREVKLLRPKGFEEETLISLEASWKTKFDELTRTPAMAKLLTEAPLDSPEFQSLLADRTESFDLIIMEYFMNEAMIGLGVKYNCPVILVSSVSPFHGLAQFTGNPTSPSTIPNVFLGFSSQMDLWQRVVNAGVWIIQEIQYKWFCLPDQMELYKSYFPDEEALVPFEDLRNIVALTFANTHPSTNIVRPLLPNTIEVGGFHIGEPLPLPVDLQRVLDESKNGAIYFSMGSYLKSSKFSDATKREVLNALAKLKQTVLWKFETDLPGKPKNVIIKSWMPQAAILAHPNVKLFISHGGLLGTTEAVFSGVPILVIPIFGDQAHNAKLVQERGNGLEMAYTNITETSLTWVLGELLNNPKYSAKAQSIQKQFHDRPISPSNLLAYYTEYALQNGVTQNKTPPNLCLFSALLLDVALVMSIPIMIFITAVYLICRRRKNDKTINKIKTN